MVYRKNELKATQVGVDGKCLREEIVPIELLCGSGRLLAVITVPPGGALVDHAHKGEFEAYYAVSGSCVYNDNGVEKALTAGDVAYCPDGESHGIRNDGTEPFVFLAFIGFPSKG